MKPPTCIGDGANQRWANVACKEGCNLASLIDGSKLTERRSLAHPADLGKTSNRCKPILMDDIATAALTTVNPSVPMASNESK